MPTAPRLPLKLHEKLGDDAMTELVTLFGDLGADSRAAFLELRDSIARLEARIADRDERIDARFAGFDARFAGFDARFAALDARFADFDARFADIDARFAALDVRFDHFDARFTDLDRGLRREIADLKPQISAVQAELIKWTFLFWIGTIGLVLLLLRFPG